MRTCHSVLAGLCFGATLKLSLCRGASVPRSCWPILWSIEDYWLVYLGTQTKQSPQGHASAQLLIPDAPLTPQPLVPGAPLTTQLLAPDAPLTPQLLAPGAPLTPQLCLLPAELCSQPVSHPSVGFTSVTWDAFFPLPVIPLSSLPGQALLSVQV